MAQDGPKSLVRDADIDGLDRGSWFGGFSRGVLLGGLGSVVALLGLSLTQPLPPHLPGVGTVTVVTPETQDVAVTDPVPEQTPVQVEDVPAVAAPISEPVVSNAGPVQEAEPAAPTQPDAAEVEVAEPNEDVPATTTTSAAQIEPEPEPQPEPVTETEPATATAEASTDGDQQQVAALTPPVAETPAPEDTTATPTDPEAAAPAAPDEAAEIAALAPVREINLSGPAVEVNARAFQAPPTAPLMAVVMEDPARGAIAPDAMALLTMPLTFAVRPDREGAQALAGAAYLAGHEVLAQLPLDEEGQGGNIPSLFSNAGSPGALANATQTYLAQLDKAIGATIPTNAEVLNDQSDLEAVLSPLAAHGFAYLDMRSGIGSTARRVSADSGFAYAESNRYAGPEATEQMIYQILDGAAFQARRKGTAIVSVAASSEALKAVVRWGLERGGQEVWFAPLSAVIARRKAG